jgi:hypothetical protein
MEEVVMSLLDQAMEKVVLLEKTRYPDGEGGFNTEWREGVEFKAAIVFDSSIQARTAEKQGVTSLYTVTTNKKAMLQYKDVFKRLSDGKIFRVTSDGDDKYTPDSATLSMRQVTAEEWNPS